MKKPGIVFAVTNDLTYDQRMHRICTSLTNGGYEVVLIGRKRKSSLPLESKPYTQRRMRCWFDRGPLFYAEYNIRLFFILLTHRAAIIGSCDLDTALAVWLAGRLKGQKMIFDAHEHFAEVPEVERRKFVRNAWHTIGKWCIPRFDVCYTVSQSLAEQLTTEYNAPFAVIRNMPLLKEHQILSAEQREKLIVYQGALNEGRGLEHAISTMQQLPDFKLRLIGEGDLSKQLRDLTHDLGLSDRVEFAGYVLPSELYALTCKAMMGLNVLEARSKSYYYSLANKFFDYMHAGVPSINMDFPEYRQIIDKYEVGVCIHELTTDTIIQAVRQIDEAAAFKTMIQACENARQEYSWQYEEEVLLKLYKG